MSAHALLLAVRDRLRQPVKDGGMGYRDQECELVANSEGKPPAFVGARFIAIHFGYNRGDDVEGLNEEYGVNVTVTRRASHVPREKLGATLYAGETGLGLDADVQAIKAKLHMDPGPRSADDPLHNPVRILANTIITGDARRAEGANGFVEPLRFRHTDGPREQGPDWFGAETDRPSTQPAGLSQTLYFGGARRVQVMEEQT